MSKNKHKSPVFNDQIKNVLDLFQVQPNYAQEFNLEQNSNPFIPQAELAQKSNKELIEYLYNQIYKLSNTNTSTNLQRGFNGDQFGETAEKLETRISECITELEKRYAAKTTYDRTEGRMLEYAKTITEAYKNAQDVMEKMEHPFNATQERQPSDNAKVDYETVRDQLTTAVTEFNNFVNTDDFDADILSENVKAAMNGSDFTPESLVDKDDLGTFLAEINKQLTNEESKRSELETRLNNEYEKAKNEWAVESGNKKNEYKKMFVDEQNRYNSQLDDINKKIASLVGKSLLGPTQAEIEELNQNVEQIKPESVQPSNDQYKINADEILSSKDVKDLEQKVTAYENSLKELNERQENLEKDIAKANNDVENLEIRNKKYQEQPSVYKTLAYTYHEELLKGHENNLEAADKLATDFSYFAIEDITPKFLKDNKLNYEMPSTAARDKAVADAVKKVYSQIGKGGIIWTKAGENLNKAAASLYGIFTKNFEALGINDELNKIEDEIYDILQDDFEDNPENKKPAEKSNDKPYDISNRFKVSYAAILSALEKNKGPKGNFADFAKISKKTGKQELLCINELIQNQKALKEFTDSINPQLEKDPEKQALLANMKKELQSVVKAIDEVSKNQLVKDTVFDLATDILEPTKEEAKIRDAIQNELNERRDKIEKNVNFTKKELEKQVNDYPKEIEQAKTDLENAKKNLEALNNQKANNTKDLEYLNLATKVASGHLAQVTSEINRSNALAEIKKLNNLKSVAAQQHATKIENIKNDVANMLNPLLEKGDKKLNDLKEKNEKELEAHDKKYQKLTTFSEKVKNLNTAKGRFNDGAPNLGNQTTILKQKKAAAINNLTTDYIKALKKVDALIKTSLEAMTNTTRFRGNSAYFTYMSDNVRATIPAEGTEPDVNQTRDQYNTSIRDARLAIENYISERDKNAGHKKTDVGQIRLDNAYKLQKLYQLKEKMIVQYHSRKSEIELVSPPSVTVKTQAEKVLVSKFKDGEQPERTEDIIKQRNVVGNSKIIEKFANIADAYKNINPTLSNKLNEHITALAKGKGSALKDVVITSVALMQQAKKQSTGILNEAQSEALVSKLAGYDCISTCTNDLLRGDIKPEELLGKIQSPEFNNELNNEIKGPQNGIENKAPDAPELGGDQVKQNEQEGPVLKNEDVPQVNNNNSNIVLGGMS